MSNIESLYSKKFKAEKDEVSFTAKSKKLHLLLEERENVSRFTLSLKGQKEFIAVFSTNGQSGNFFEIPTFEGETYKLTFTTAGQMTSDSNDEMKSSPSSASVSAIWEQ
ncbi:hypothetical protein Q4561_02065 [Alteromonas sp. 1_MG-2023]|jgi:hypothetical protein|uniref:hypothetical protein n=1 Tax=Alteromonas sp. 1_MG-2023 TaxID=3062669 RepID=UPI0026E2D4BC|nr:hypothetical protein [Alteromonas sp. 1_MG-2023]MDO6565833.1 hypothetical protein [Alteromonas sp. 1_MG-2023]